MKLLIERQSAATTKYETDLGSVSQAKQQCAASESNAAASAQSASDDKTSASNSAASAAQSASEASQIAGLDTLASGVGALSPRFDTPDFECPFNDGIELKSGYGNRNAYGNRAIDYSCASAKTSINKSDQQVTLAENEPAIESSGIALFQSLTNKNPNSNKLTHDSKYSETEVSGLFRYEILSDDTAYNLLKFSTYCTSDIGVAFKIKIKDLTGINSIRFRYGNNYIDVNSNLDEEVDIYIPYTSGDKTNCSAYINGYEASPVGTGFTLEYAQVIDGVNITNAPYIPTSGTAVTRAADVAKVTSVNNLPAPGKPFYIVGDVDFGNVVTGQYRAILELDNSTQLKIEVSNTGLFRFRLSNKTLQSDDVISSKARIICYFNGSEYGYYLNTVKGKSAALDNVNYEFTNINLSKTPALNGHLKNWTIKQGVMTDDLAKSYGEHPDA